MGQLSGGLTVWADVPKQNGARDQASFVLEIVCLEHGAWLSVVATQDAVHRDGFLFIALFKRKRKHQLTDQACSI
jgi:hypothetical protein